MKTNKYNILWWVCLITFSSIIAFATFTPIFYRYHYIKDCRHYGGIPISNGRYINCAKEGYLDIK